jgi:hypothetical protein
MRGYLVRNQPQQLTVTHGRDCSSVMFSSLFNDCLSVGGLFMSDERILKETVLSLIGNLSQHLPRRAEARIEQPLT